MIFVTGDADLSHINSMFALLRVATFIYNQAGVILKPVLLQQLPEVNSYLIHQFSITPSANSYKMM